ncbi:hypothetical protein CEXT_648111, partial [Caerostris extrusa]
LTVFKRNAVGRRTAARFRESFCFGLLLVCSGICSCLEWMALEMRNSVKKVNGPLEK